jgi:8-hydroxy-5-deazaflavin:NADPH oxidoreductase
MNIGIIGSGWVAQTLGTKLAELGHTVTLSSRDTTKPKERAAGVLPSADEWVAAQRSLGRSVLAASFAAAASRGEVVINATAGEASLEALALAGRESLRDKILVDVANPLDFSLGTPPKLLYCNNESLGEKIQAAFPESRVVKTLNTVTAQVMVDPASLPEETDLFIAGNDADAKTWVRTNLLEALGWHRVADLGDITAARGMEMYLTLWLRLPHATGTRILNVRLVAAA